MSKLAMFAAAAALVCVVPSMPPPQGEAKTSTVAPMVLRTRTLTDHRYALTGSVTDMRPIGINGYFVALEPVASRDHAHLTGFVEAVQPARVDVLADGRSAKLTFGQWKGKHVAFLDAKRFRPGAKIQLRAWGTTTKPSLGVAPGKDRLVFGTGFTLP